MVDGVDAWKFKTIIYGEGRFKNEKSDLSDLWFKTSIRLFVKKITEKNNSKKYLT